MFRSRFGRAASVAALATLAAFLPLASSSAGASTKFDGSVTIGLIQSQSGTYGDYGPPVLAGVKVAVDDVNSSGGILINGKHYQLKYIAVDDNSNPQTSLADANKLVTDDGIKIMLGPLALAATTVIPFDAEHGIMEFTPYPIEPGAPVPGSASAPYYFDSASSGPFAMAASLVAARHFAPTAKTIALVAPSSAAMQLQVPMVVKEAKREGFTVHTYVYPVGTTDLSSIASQIVASHPGVIWAGDSDSADITALQALNSAGLPTSVPMYAYSAVDDIFGDAAGRKVIVGAEQSFSTLTGTPALNAMDKQVLKVIPASEANSGVAIYYPTIPDLVEAMEQAKSTTDLAAITKALVSDKPVPVLGGLIKVSFSKNHYFQTSISTVEATHATNNPAQFYANPPASLYAGVN
jgi:ABC-type branched-subunit amino acid transport system substrate-binding protein